MLPDARMLFNNVVTKEMRLFPKKHFVMMGGSLASFATPWPVLLDLGCWVDPRP